MESLLNELTGKKIDVNCGSNVMYRGEVLSAGGGVLKLQDEDGQEIFVSIDKIAAFSERRDAASRPGFII